MSETQNSQYQRAPALVVSLGKAAKASLLEEEDGPVKIVFDENTKATRINVVGVVTDQEKIGSITNITLDDGTGKIIVRSFEEMKKEQEIGVGCALLVIGKLRTYNEEKYISPEVCKKIDLLWLKVRAKQLQDEPTQTPQEETQKEQQTKSEIIQEPIQEAAPDEQSTLPEEKIMQLIREMDQGDGVGLEEIKEKCSLNNVDFLLERMLERGDIFQITPGKIKVL